MLTRLNYLQYSALRADLVVAGTPEIISHIKTKPHLDIDILHRPPDTVTLGLKDPKLIYGPEQTGTVTAKVVAYFGPEGFPVRNDLLLFLRKEGPAYYVIDYKAAGKKRFELEREVIDTNTVEEKGMIGPLSIHRNWNRKAGDADTKSLSFAGLRNFIALLREHYILAPFCFVSPVDIGVYFLAKDRMKYPGGNSRP